MAMYYQGSSEIQPDTLQTLYLMNPNYVGYSDSTQPQSNMLFFSSAPTTAAATTIHGLNAPPQLVGLPQSHDLGHQENISAPRLQYNIWSLIDQSANVSQANTHQALSLSLSAAAHQTDGGGGSLKPLPASDFQDFPAAGRKNSNGGNTMQSVIMGSKYLKAAQELLDEVAHVGKENKNDRNKAKLAKESNCADTAAATACGGGEIGEKSGGGGELTTAQRQEIQMKKAKLSTMLDEVEQRYREYHQQMQMVVASLEQAAGIGAAKSYTQLALKTILRQFRCLKCTISAQIRGLCRSLGEEEVRFVEHHQVRQQRALQQLGMMHNNNAWRPQRGLPERAVSVLRAWLFEHFLHPYPKDSDKHMLAKQTGLTRSQVSNWFINARVRLWKPMVEEMYLEEMKNQEESTKLGPDHSESPHSKFNPGPEIDNHLNAALRSHQRKLVLNLTENISANSPTGSSVQPRPGFSSLFTSPNTITLPENNPKKPRNETQDNSPSSILSGADMEIKAAGDQKSNGFMMDNNVKFGNARESYVSMAANIAIGNQQMDSMGFNFQGNNNHSSNNFSLSLALPPSETTSQGARVQNFLSHRKFQEFGTRIAQSGVESNGINNQAAAGYEILDFQNRKPYPEIII